MKKLILLLLITSSVFSQTKNLVPRANLEGKLGTSVKRWDSLNVNGINALGNIVGANLSGVNTGDQNLSALASKSDTLTFLATKTMLDLKANLTDPRFTDARTPLAHSHSPSDVTGTAVITTDPRLSDARTPLAHTHTKSNITDFAHTHAQSDITNLVTDLAGKEPANANIQAHVLSAHAPANAQKNSDITIGEIEAKLVGVISSHSHAGGGGGINMLKKTADQTINAGAGVFTDVTGLTFSVTSGTDYAFKFYIVFRSAATTTGYRAGVNCPTGDLSFFATSQTVASGAAGVATWTQRHNTVRDDMTLLTATIAQNVDLVVMIEGSYRATANGTFAVRFANELASNTDIVVKKGSWGTWF